MFHFGKYKEFIRFSIVGILATMIHYGIYLFLYKIIVTEVAYTIAYFISFLLNFYLSNVFTFKTKPSFRKGVGFGLSHGVNYLLHISLLTLFLYIGIPEAIAPIPVFLIVIPVNFLLVRFVLKSSKI
ncbi:GtrA family protein [Coprobacter sp.]